MSMSDDLKSQVTSTFKSAWTTRAGTVVPEDTSIGLGNDAVTIDGTVLYADLAESTKLVLSRAPNIAAEVYKSFLYCAAKVVRARGGEVTAYDGDRIMAVFIGGYKNTSAAKAALQINWYMQDLVNPAARERYPNAFLNEMLRAFVGIDTSPLFVARTGIRGANDLVWVGRAANYAAKLSAIRDGNFTTWITADVYAQLAEEAKTSNGGAMWEQQSWASTGLTVYRSGWKWKPE